MKPTRQYALRRLMARLFEVDEAAIVSGLQIGDVPNWDSLGHAKLMLAVEDEFEIAMTADEMSEILSVEDIDAILDEKLGSGS